jgi:hypothetical protein
MREKVAAEEAQFKAICLGKAPRAGYTAIG